MKRIILAFGFYILALGIVGCEENNMENVGEEIDKVGENVGDTLDNVGNDIEDVCEEATDSNC